MSFAYCNQQFASHKTADVLIKIASNNIIIIHTPKDIRNSSVLLWLLCIYRSDICKATSEFQNIKTNSSPVEIHERHQKKIGTSVGYL